jgi:hypothetical protein
MALKIFSEAESILQKVPTGLETILCLEPYWCASQIWLFQGPVQDCIYFIFDAALPEGGQW